MATATARPYFPALAKVYEPLTPYGWTLIRIVLGLYLMKHGYPKVFEGATAGIANGVITKLGLTPPLMWAYIVAAAEFGGGLLLVLGLLTRLAAFVLTIEFAVIVFAIKWANGFFAFAPKALQPGFPGLIPGGFELELFLGICCVAVLMSGAGPLSVDRAIGREL